jgi:hypothetical protein
MAFKPQKKIAADSIEPSGKTESQNQLAATPKPPGKPPQLPDIGPGTLVILGLDVHARQITVVRQIDHSLPQPAQRMDQATLLTWVGKMIAAGARILSCYEAGCFGYVLHRMLTALGVENIVVAPEAWCGANKTDKHDARKLCLRREPVVERSDTTGNHAL